MKSNIQMSEENEEGWKAENKEETEEKYGS